MCIRDRFRKTKSDGCDRFRPKIVKFRALLVIVQAFQAGNSLFESQGMCCVEHRECLAWNTGNVLLGTQGMSYVEHRASPARNARNVLLGTQGMSCVAHKDTVPEIVRCTVSRTRTK